MYHRVQISEQSKERLAKIRKHFGVPLTTAQVVNMCIYSVSQNLNTIEFDHPWLEEADDVPFEDEEDV